MPVSGKTVLMVLRADFAKSNTHFRLYIDPGGDGVEPATPSIAKPDLNIGTISSIEIGGPGAFSVDELRVGSTYESVTTAPIPPKTATAPATATTPSDSGSVDK